MWKLQVVQPNLASLRKCQHKSCCWASEEQVLKEEQNGFTKREQFLTNPTNCWETTASAEEEGAIVILFLISKVSDEVCQKFPMTQTYLVWV